MRPKKQTAFCQTTLTAALAIVIVLCISIIPSVEADTEYPLRVSPQGDFSEFWYVARANLREGINGTEGDLQIQNVSRKTIEGAVFYAEYFDTAGRFCFSLAFSQEHNVVSSGPMAPGEVRDFVSSTVGLFPATEPQKMKLYLVQQDMPDPRKWNVSLRAPVTIFGGIGVDDTKIQLHDEVNLAKGSMLDMVLAKVSVDQAGVVAGVDFLNTVSSSVESWFRNFVHQVAFYPATENGSPKSQQALVLVRASLSEISARNVPLPPRRSPWVESYTAQLADTEISPVTEILFRRPPTTVKHLGDSQSVKRPPAPPGIFEALLLQSYWCSPPFRFVSDPSMPHHERREMLVKSH